MTQPKTGSKLSSHTPGPLRAYERNTDPMNWAIRDADNHMVAEHIPKQLALLFVKALEMYELLRHILTADGVPQSTASGPMSRKDIAWVKAIYEEARRIKAAIDGEG